MTLRDFRDKVIGDLKMAVEKLFPGLVLNNLGNPLEEGTFTFEKGLSDKFKYKNLSGGEKAAFDLILDVIVKRKSYNNTIYCIDEPELHMNTRLQSALLETLYGMIPEASQLWIATHSIGMMRKAHEIWRKNPRTVAFLDFGQIDPDQTCTITPSVPSRGFWERVLAVALDDLANLVAPEEVIVCEGNPIGTTKSKNVEFDAIVYNRIFGDSMPGLKFISSGNSSSVAEDRLAIAKTLPMVAKGMKVSRLIDRDDHAPETVAEFQREGVRVLYRRHIESYLYDDEVLELLCRSVGKPEKISDILALKQEAIQESISRGNAPDDVKSAAGTIYIKLKQALQLTGVGNDASSFAKFTLAPLIAENSKVFGEMRLSIFGEK